MRAPGLFGGGGADTLVGGPGDDLLESNRRFIEHVIRWVLIGCSLLIAGRTRRVAHPALLAATVAAIAALALVANGIVTQSRELREAASSDIQAYSDANRTSSELSGLRVTEISAVAARGSGAPLYTTFEEQAAELLAELDEAEGDSAAIAEHNGKMSSSLSCRRTAPLALINYQLREKRSNIVLLPGVEGVEVASGPPCCWLTRVQYQMNPLLSVGRVYIMRSSCTRVKSRTLVAFPRSMAAPGAPASEA